MGMNKSWFVLVLNLIGWQSSASFLNQLRSELKQTKEIPAYFHDSIQNFLKLDHIRAWQLFTPRLSPDNIVQKLSSEVLDW